MMDLFSLGGAAAPRNDKAGRQPGSVDTADTTAPEFSYPAADTVKAAVLADLLNGRAITHLDCWKEHGSSRLAHHILRLRQLGWSILTVEYRTPTSDGRVAHIARYSLRAGVIEQAGERGREFIAAVRQARARRAA